MSSAQNDADLKKDDVEKDTSSNIVNRYAKYQNEVFSKSFHWLGSIVGRHPWTIIAGALLATVCFGFGLIALTEENRGEKLWVPQNTRATDDRKLYESFFEGSRRSFVIAEPTDGNSIISKSNIQQLFILYEQILDLSVEVDGQTENLRSLCVRDNTNGEPCLVVSVLENWNYNSTLLDAEASDASVLATINSQRSALYLQDYLGGIETDSSGAVTWAQAAQMVFFLEKNEVVEDGSTVDEQGEAWEQVFLDYTLEPQNTPDFPALRVFPEAVRSISDEFGDAIGGDINQVTIAYVILFVYVAINLGKIERSCVQMRFSLSFMVIITVGLSIISSYGIASALGFIFTPLHSLLPFVLLGIGVDDSFVIAEAFDAISTSVPVAERVAEALSHAGVSVTITSVTDMVAFAISSASSLPALASFAVYATFGIVFLYLYQITFFTAALALDGKRQQSKRKDCLCCLTARSGSVTGNDNKGDDDDEEGAVTAAGEQERGVREGVRGGVASSNGEVEMGEAGKSYQAVPATSRETGEIMSKQTANGGGRSPDNGYHALDSSSSPDAAVSMAPVERKGINKFMGEHYAPFLMKPVVKVLVLASFLALLVVCILGATQLSVESNERSFIPDGSYLLDTLDRVDQYFGENGVPVQIVTHSYDHFAHQGILFNMQDTLVQSTYIKDPFGPTYESWYNDYLAYVNANSSAPLVTVNAEGQPVAESEFYSALRFYLNTQGARYNSSVVFENAQSVEASRVQTEYENFKKYRNGRLDVDADKAVRAMDDLRDICDALSQPVFPWTFEYTTWESYKIIERELYQGLGFSLMAVTLIVLATVASPTTSLLIALSVTSTLACLLGVMYYWGLVIDNVSVINLILAVGLAVDYSAHVGHKFMMIAGTREERVIGSLESIGAAVLNGATSTFLAVVLLSTSESYVFRVLFVQFFATVVLGAGHGLILLPVVLSLVGPPAYDNAIPIAPHLQLQIEKREKEVSEKASKKKVSAEKNGVLVGEAAAGEEEAGAGTGAEAEAKRQEEEGGEDGSDKGGGTMAVVAVKGDEDNV